MAATVAAAAGAVIPEAGGSEVNVTHQGVRLQTLAAAHQEASENSGGPVRLAASLSGSNETPGPGARDALGTFSLDVAAPKGCYDLRVTMGERPTGAHLHQGLEGTAGPTVADLAPAFTATESAYVAQACITLPADVAERLKDNPPAYYLNIESAAHPGGALRGQLQRSP